MSGSRMCFRGSVNSTGTGKSFASNHSEIQTLSTYLSGAEAGLADTMSLPSLTVHNCCDGKDRTGEERSGSKNSAHVSFIFPQRNLCRNCGHSLSYSVADEPLNPNARSGSRIPPSSDMSSNHIDTMPRAASRLPKPCLSLCMPPRALQGAEGWNVDVDHLQTTTRAELTAGKLSTLPLQQTLSLPVDQSPQRSSAREDSSTSSLGSARQECPLSFSWTPCYKQDCMLRRSVRFASEDRLGDHVSPGCGPCLASGLTMDGRSGCTCSPVPCPPPSYAFCPTASCSLVAASRSAACSCGCPPHIPKAGHGLGTAHLSSPMATSTAGLTPSTTVGSFPGSPPKSLSAQSSVCTLESVPNLVFNPVAGGSGNQLPVSSSKGDSSSGFSSSGDSCTRNSPTGDKSTGNSSTGDNFSGNSSTGDTSTGNSSTGDNFSGNMSTGNRFTGNISTRDSSMQNCSAGNSSSENQHPPSSPSTENHCSCHRLTSLPAHLRSSRSPPPPTFGEDSLPSRTPSSSSVESVDSGVWSPGPSPITPPTTTPFTYNNPPTPVQPSPPSLTLTVDSRPSADPRTKCEIDLDRLGRSVRALQDACFYYPDLTSDEAQDLLEDAPLGTYLVRDSSDARFLFAVSLKTERGPTSVRIRYEKGHFQMDCASQLKKLLPRLETMVELLDFHTAVCRDPQGAQYRWREVSACKDLIVTLSTPRRHSPPALRHLARVTINRCLEDLHLPARSTDLLPLPAPMRQYLRKYPYRV